jgi:hypothetical protein
VVRRRVAHVGVPGEAGMAAREPAHRAVRLS